MREKPGGGVRAAGAVTALTFALAAVYPAPGDPPEAGIEVEAVLPPEIPWEGRSRSLALGPDDPWATPCERSGLLASPGYDETMGWLRRLAAASPEVQGVSLGRSPEGRDLWMFIASAGRAFTPAALRATRKPVVLVQAGIHSGEIDGKDAGMMLLRDMTVRGVRREILDRVEVLFVPIFSVDGHERSSRHGRINQRGPEKMGWRTTARNLNLNRDYAKLDALEMRAMVRALGEWVPDLYLDIHVTDGIDYQYDVTFGWNGPHAHSPAIGRYLDQVARPRLSRDLEAWGHIPGPLIFARDNDDLSLGIVDWTAGPRFSTGYGDLRHLPTILVENHSLKPYPQRVLGTYVFLDSLLRLVGETADDLRRAVASDRERRPERVPLGWAPAPGPPPTFPLKAVASRRLPSEATGGDRLAWTGEPVAMEVPYIRFTEPARTVAVPAAYWIPPAWHDVMERLELHGIRVEHTVEAREVEVEMYRIQGPSLAAEPFEGHAQVQGNPVSERRLERFPAGSGRVPVDQPLGELAVVLLEPDSPDSFFRFGFFLEVLTRTEYVEEYVMAPTADRMLAEEPALAEEFRRLLAEDPEFAADRRARLDWLYRRTPYYDDRENLYPVAREIRRAP